MTTTTTPKLGLTLPIPGSAEPFSTSLLNANFEALDTKSGLLDTADATAKTAATALTTRVTTAETQLATLVIAEANVTTFGTNWTASPLAAEKPRLKRTGKQVFLYGTISFGLSGGGGAYANMLTVPTAFRPTTTTARSIGSSVIKATGGTPLSVGFCIQDGIVGAAFGPSYSTGSLPFDTNVPMVFMWWMD